MTISKKTSAAPCLYLRPSTNLRKISGVIHQSGDKRENNQSWGKQTVPIILAGNQCASCFGKV